MMKDNLFQNPNEQTKPANIFFSGANTIAIYTALCVLQRMKEKLGLEAMLEYIEGYRKTIDRSHPDIQSAVEKALVLINVENIYKEALENEKR